MNDVLKDKVFSIETHLKAVKSSVEVGLGIEQLDFHLDEVIKAAQFIKDRDKIRIVNEITK